MKYQSDCCDAFRMYAVDYAFPAATEKTMVEEFNELIAPEYKPPVGRAMTLEEQMSYQVQKEIAAEKMREKYGFDDEEEDDDPYDSYW